MIHSKFDFEIVSLQNRDIIQIDDLCIGGTSVTNDIENVVDYIARLSNINPADYMILYRDSTGFWDGWDFNTESFTLLHERDFADAVEKYKSLQLIIE